MANLDDDLLQPQKSKAVPILIGVIVLLGGGFGAYVALGGKDAKDEEADGAAIGQDFQINTYVAGSQQDVALAALGNAAFVAVWASDGQDGAGMGIFAQRYDGLAATVGPEFQVNEYANGNQWYADVAALPGGGFITVWQSDSSQDGAGAGVFARRYNHDGTPLYH